GSADLLRVQDFGAWASRGISARLDGRLLVLGNGRLLREHGIDAAALEERAAALAAQGRTVSWLAEAAPAPKLLGLIAFGDDAKPTSAAAIARLHEMGIETIMLSGDSRGAAEAVAARLGIDRVEAGILPQDKAALIAELRRQVGGAGAMVGEDRKRVV